MKNLQKLAEIEQGPKETIVAKLREGKGEVLPIISNSLTHSLIFGSDKEVISFWAEHIDYPLPGRVKCLLVDRPECRLSEEYNLAQMCQYLHVMKKADPNVKATDRYVKETYLKFLWLLLEAQTEETSQGLLRKLRADVNFEKFGFTERARRLERPAVSQGSRTSLELMASFELPIYLTTSYHKLLELALEKDGRVKPRTEICYWNDNLRRIPSVFADKSYQPSPREPLVFHLFGLEDYDDSVVLTEDDHLNFLVAISRKAGIIPLPVQEALAASSLLLVGYRLRNWDFRVLFQGIIKPTDKGLRPRSIAIQVEEDKDEQPYLQNYLDQAKFEVVVGQAETFIRDLWQRWKA